MIIIVVCLLFLSVLLHELGHFLAALVLGCKIESLSMGFGKTIYTFKYKGIEYKLKSLPLGGDCQLKGERNYSPDSDAFCNLIYRKKFLVAIIGCLINFLIGIICLLFPNNFCLYLVGIINIGLGIGNLLPIPCLDGSIPIFVWLAKFLGQEKGYKLFIKINKNALIIWTIINVLCIPIIIYYIFNFILYHIW